MRYSPRNCLETLFYILLITLLAGVVTFMSIILKFKMGSEFTWIDSLRIYALSITILSPVLIFRRHLSQFFSSCYWPGKSDGPQPVYSAAEALRMQNCSAEALCEYAKIIEHYPKIAKAYIEMMDIYDLDFKDRDAAKRIYELAKERISGKSERKKLEAAWADINRGNPTPVE